MHILWSQGAQRRAIARLQSNQVIEGKMSLPYWYSQYLALRKEGANPLSEITSIPFMANAFQCNEVFLVPLDGIPGAKPLESTFILPRDLSIVGSANTPGS